MNVDTLIDRVLDRAVAASEVPGAPPMLGQAIRHAVFPGGARVRPKLCVAVTAACGEGRGMEAASGAAAALELMHCASLVHDDLPAFDGAAIRRGKPSVHSAFGEPLAVLAGDAMIVIAFETLLNQCRSAPELLPALMTILIEAVGSPRGIVAGQAWESEASIDLSAYHQAKTGALFVAASMSGAAAAGLDPAPWRALGERLGEAYQVADDLRDVLLDEAELGKPAGQDASLLRPNAVHNFGVAGAIARLKGLIADASDSIPDCAGAPMLRDIVHGQAARLMPKSLLRDVA
ncbi:MAG: polyprenyl synthetase family protein [Hyphomonas sp.]